MAMSSAVFTPLPISSSLRCSAAESSSNGASPSNVESLKLPQLAVSRSQPLSVNHGEASVMSVLHPGLEHVNVMYFKGTYNTQVFVGEDEPADSVVRRFRKAVMAAGVIPECRRRRYHETPQDIVKRKQKESHRRKARSQDCRVQNLCRMIDKDCRNSVFTRAYICHSGP
uniref:Plastid ribosomal protein S21 n=1 Tax=Physcomitrium patens TaxID=3218 RepID=A0A7I4C1X2_PHYPA